MNQFRTRLIVIFVLLTGLSVLAAGIFTAKLLEKSYIDSLKDSMQREIRLIAAGLDTRRSGNQAELVGYYNEEAKQLRDSAGARVTFIGADGTVLGDSDHDPATMDNHKGRNEIVDATGRTAGFSIRKSDTLHTDMLYVAVAMPNAQNGQLGFIRLAMGLENVDSLVRAQWLFLLVGLLILFVVVVGVSYRVAYGLTRPLEKIMRVANQITHMNYRSRVPVTSKDEIGKLGHAINTMADSLQAQVDRISENESQLKNVLENLLSGIIMIDKNERIVLLNRAAEDFIGFGADEVIGKKFDEAKQPFEFVQLIGECLDTREHIRDEMLFYYPEERILEINVTPIMGADDEWAGVLIVLHNITAMRRLERMRSEFVANVSHELKTPIASVKGFAETLLAGALDDKETAKSFLKIIFDESERLNRLIGDILELSKIESKRIPLQFSPVEMKGFVEQTLHVMRSEAAKKRIELEMSVPADMYIEADEDRLRQIVINLLSNGIAYTPEGGKVKVTVEPLATGVEPEYERIRLTIADTGIGIPRKDLPRIFERFYRVDKARSRSSGGTGLGLSIVKHLVDLHKGTIAVESEVGLGTRFTIELPVIH
ncbi:two-component system histidine kinase PnpS [Paenibacillus cymbidii]|uniref:two-component system histidine kinase PnpS n=1 Tax=Paenibacillus cymbidii TaxID=1639034 RepID=UPI0010804013|nr:ATP-binding protein [Paenibacillus cymbidii]